MSSRRNRKTAGLLVLVVAGCALALPAAAGWWRGHARRAPKPLPILAQLIERLGVVRIMTWGCVIFGIAVATGLMGREVAHYGGSMVLLGVGWNFLLRRDARSGRRSTPRDRGSG